MISNISWKIWQTSQLWENAGLNLFSWIGCCHKNFYYTFKGIVKCLLYTEWIPCEKPFDGAESSSDTLENTHRICYRLYRIKDAARITVTFFPLRLQKQGLWKEITISGENLSNRFLMHVPPKRFAYISGTMVFFHQEIRKKKITIQKHPWLQNIFSKLLKDIQMPAIIRLLYNRDICKCSSCGSKIILCLQNNIL